MTMSMRSMAESPSGSPRRASGGNAMIRKIPATNSRPHRVAVLALHGVVAFDLSVPAQVFGHRVERRRYALKVCAPRPGPVPTSTGFSVLAEHGLDAVTEADTVIVPGVWDV